MVASQFVLVNHFFLALVHNTPDPATVPDLNSVVVNAGCDRGCRLCSPVNGCLACEPPYFLVLHRDGVRQTASCTKTCPQGFYKVKKKRNGFCSKCTMLGCEECLGPHYCSTCQHHYFNYFGRCIRETPGKNKTGYLSTTTEHPMTTEDVERQDGGEEETRPEKEEDVKREKEKEEEGIQIMVTSHTPTTTTITTALPSSAITLTPTPSSSPSPPVSTPTTTPSSPSSDRGRGRLRPCRRRRRRKKHKHGRKDTKRRRNRNKERRKDALTRRRQCRRRGRGGRRGRRRKGRRWEGRRREKRRKTTAATPNVNATTIITITTETPSTTQMIDLSLLGEEGQVGDTHLSGSPTQLDGHKFFYNNRPREMARYKQLSAHRRRKPAYVRGKRVRHAKIK